jgi:hypothetical protein
VPRELTCFLFLDIELIFQVVSCKGLGKRKLEVTHAAVVPGVAPEASVSGLGSVRLGMLLIA